MSRLIIAAFALAVPLLGLPTGAEQSEKPAAVPEFRHHFVTTDLPSRDGQGDYGLTALADLDGDGDLEFICGGRIPGPPRLYARPYTGIAAPLVGAESSESRWAMTPAIASGLTHRS